MVAPCFLRVTRNFSSAGNQMDDVAFLVLHVVSFAITVWAS